ncbi:MAG: glycosyltransferase family 4 protein [Proteobacteria bacterium]|nr:glycosyltransferase family 4 protein [Pseudomonadota bacterium]
MTPASRFRRAYVIGAYLPNGGTRMAYALGTILERDFGIPAVAVQVGNESPDHGIHAYDVAMPQVTLAQMQAQIGAADILVVNPSFSPHQFGLRLPGFKLCYVQGFNTFALLDQRFQHYVAASDFVAGFLRDVYGLHARVIAPYVELERMPPTADWESRPPLRVLPYRKGLPEVWDASFARMREIVTAQAPEIEFDEALDGGALAQPELFARLGRVRHLLTLSAAEGFGLVPLEAMAMGTLVVGFDGYGGRQYMRPGENCLVAPYPQVERVAENLIAAVRDPTRSARIAQRGRETARGFSLARFRQAWIEELARALAM